MGETLCGDAAGCLEYVASAIWCYLASWGQGGHPGAVTSGHKVMSHSFIFSLVSEDSWRSGERKIEKKDCNQTQKSCPKLSELISLSISLLQSLNCTLCGPQTGAIANFDIFYLATAIAVTATIPSSLGISGAERVRFRTSSSGAIKLLCRAIRRIRRLWGFLFKEGFFASKVGKWKQLQEKDELLISCLCFLPYL